MCRFIKEDGERCGIDTEPFCHMHEDTPQSHFYHSMEELKDDLGEVMDMVEEARSEDTGGAVSGSAVGTMQTTCDDCEAPLRRTERLTEHPNIGGRVVFEAVVECECDEHVLGATSVRESELPSGWSP
jgi:hypothetical protein